MRQGKDAQLFLPEQIYWFPLLLVVAAVGGMTRLHFVRRKVFTETQLRALWLLMVTLGLVALSFAAFLAKYMQTQGRYLYPAMLPICLLLALGWLAVFPAKYRSLAGGCLLVLYGSPRRPVSQRRAGRRLELSPGTVWLANAFGRVVSSDRGSREGDRHGVRRIRCRAG